MSIVCCCAPRYHSLWTSANSWSTGGRPSAGSTMIIPNMPLAMCISAGRGAAVVHEDAGVLRLELVDQLLAGIDRAHLVVPGDQAGVEVDRVRHGVRLGVDERHADEVAHLHPQHRPGDLVTEGPDQLLVALGHGHLDLAHDELDLVHLALRDGGSGRVAQHVLGRLWVRLDQGGATGEPWSAWLAAGSAARSYLCSRWSRRRSRGSSRRRRG